jgi:hypothetical protein
MMKRKGRKRKRSWRIIQIYPWTGLRKKTENLSQDVRCPGQVSNSKPHDYALEILPREVILFLYRVHPVAYVQTILLCLYLPTQRKEGTTFNSIYWFHNMFRPFFRHHRVNTIVYQMLFWIATISLLRWAHIYNNCSGGRYRHNRRIRFVSSLLYPEQTQNLNTLTCRLIISQ